MEVRYELGYAWLDFLPQSAAQVVKCFLHYFEKPAFQAPMGLIGAGRRVSVMLICLFSAAWAVTTWRRRGSAAPASLGLCVALALSVGTSLSWQMLAINHMCVHSHLNLIVFYMPFLLLAYAACGQWLTQMLTNWDLDGVVRRAGLPLALLTIAALATRYADSVIAGRVRSQQAREAVAAVLRGERPQDPVVARGCIDVVEPCDAPSLSREMNNSTLRPPAGTSGIAVSGWAFNAEDPLAPRVLVVVQGTHLYAASDVETCNRLDVERALNVTAPHCGYRFWAPVLPGAQGKPRVFLVTGKNWSKVVELPVPG
jgi:hypothetical protein